MIETGVAHAIAVHWLIGMMQARLQLGWLGRIRAVPAGAELLGNQRKAVAPKVQLPIHKYRRRAEALRASVRAGTD